MTPYANHIYWKPGHRVIINQQDVFHGRAGGVPHRKEGSWDQERWMVRSNFNNSLAAERPLVESGGWAMADLIKLGKEKKIHITKSEAEEFYKVHQTKPFYNDLCEYLSSGTIFVMVLEKENAVADNRNLMGATNPSEAKEGTLRKKYGLSIDKNSVHGSDSVENANKEINFFFKD